MRKLLALPFYFGLVVLFMAAVCIGLLADAIAGKYHSRELLQL